MRLIDADALMDEANFDGAYGYIDAKQISEAPTIDAVPVVRCRECKLHTSSAFYPDRLFCQEHGRYVDPIGYCYLGERKEGADNES